MTNRTGLGPVILLLVLLVCVAITPNTFGLYGSPNTAIHHFDMPCISCHESVSNNGFDAGPLTSDINTLCTGSCHVNDSVLNHPVGVSPTASIPSHMPLDNNYRMTCLTCHLDSNNGVVDQYSENSLTTPSGRGFCASCHASMGGTTKQMSHWQFSDKAHLGSISPDKNFSGSSSEFTGWVDQESRTCLGCHDDVTVTTPPSTYETLGQRQKRWKNMPDHPIGMDYISASNKMPGQYFPQIRNDRVRLFQGALGCGSCHSLYAREKGNMAVTNHRDEICRQCHNR